MKLGWLENAYLCPFLVIWGILTSKVTWFLVCDLSSLEGLYKYDYKSLCAAVMICATLVNIQTDTQTYAQRAF